MTIWEAIQPMLPWLLAILIPYGIGLLQKSPVGKYFPDPWMDIIGRLDPVDYATLIQRFGTREQRRETAIVELQEWLSGKGVTVDRNVAAGMIGYLEAQYKRLRK